MSIIIISSQNMESARLIQSLSDTEQVDYLQKKYKGICFDAVIAESDSASTFVNIWIIWAPFPGLYYTGLTHEKKPATHCLQPQSRQAIVSTRNLPFFRIRSVVKL